MDTSQTKEYEQIHFGYRVIKDKKKFEEIDGRMKSTKNKDGKSVVELYQEWLKERDGTARRH